MLIKDLPIDGYPNVAGKVRCRLANIAAGKYFKPWREYEAFRSTRRIEDLDGKQASLSGGEFGTRLRALAISSLEKVGVQIVDGRFRVARRSPSPDVALAMAEWC